MKRTTSPILPIPVDRELKSLVKVAAGKTRLSQADVIRSALRLGIPEVVRRHVARNAPRRPLMEYLDAFAALIKPQRELVTREQP